MGTIHHSTNHLFICQEVKSRVSRRVEGRGVERRGSRVEASTGDGRRGSRVGGSLDGGHKKVGESSPALCAALSPPHYLIYPSMPYFTCTGRLPVSEF
jgi:hypothetical protein